MQTIDASRAACSSYGFQPGSDAFAECVQKEQHLHTLLIYAGGGGAASQPQTLPPLSDPAPPMQAPALPPLPQPQTQFCFGSGAFEQCPAHLSSVSDAAATDAAWFPKIISPTAPVATRDGDPAREGVGEPSRNRSHLSSLYRGCGMACSHPQASFRSGQWTIIGLVIRRAAPLKI